MTSSLPFTNLERPYPTVRPLSVARRHSCASEHRHRGSKVRLLRLIPHFRGFEKSDEGVVGVASTTINIKGEITRERQTEDRLRSEIRESKVRTGTCVAL
eukprot:213369-Hanusia_phi.AAC.1